MINKIQAKKYCAENISNIENYDLAVNDLTQMWDCHHRRETIYSRDDLKRIDEYFSRPAAELIFLTKAVHRKLHHSGNKHYLYKKHLPDETKAKISAKVTGFKHSKEAIEKIRASSKGRHNTLGMHWYNDGIKSTQAYECPEGFKKGRL